MRTLDILLTFLGALMGAGTTDSEIITVDHRFSGIACRGLCVNSHLVVRSDGVAEASVEPLGGDVMSRSFRITPEEFAEFRRVYSAIRPVGLKGPIGKCDEHTLVIDWDIRWAGPDRNARLLACRDIEEVRKAYVDGYRALRIWPGTVGRVSAKEAENIR